MKTVHAIQTEQPCSTKAAVFPCISLDEQCLSFNQCLHSATAIGTHRAGIHNSVSSFITFPNTFFTLSFFIALGNLIPYFSGFRCDFPSQTLQRVGVIHAVNWYCPLMAISTQGVKGFEDKGNLQALAYHVLPHLPTLSKLSAVKILLSAVIREI